MARSWSAAASLDEAVVKLEDLGNLELKGLRRPAAAFNVAQSPSAVSLRGRPPGAAWPVEA